MAEVLVVFLLLLLVAAGVAVAVLVALVHALVMRNRVVPGQRSPAPLTWLVAPDHAARLHRRLRHAMTMAGAATGPSAAALGLDDVVGRLGARAVELDEQLVIASRAPKPARRRMLRELQTEVIELERLAERTVRMSRAWRASEPSDRGLSEVRERLELLESALRELDGVELARPDAREVRRLQR
jgi:hypothetical protein